MKLTLVPYSMCLSYFLCLLTFLFFFPSILFCYATHYYHVAQNYRSKHLLFSWLLFLKNTSSIHTYHL